MKGNCIFTKERSVKACVIDSWRVFALNWRIYLQCCWTYVLLVGLSGAFLCEMCLQYAQNQLLPAWRLHEIGGPDEAVRAFLIPALDTLVYLLLSAAVFVCSLHILGGRVGGMIVRYGQTDKLDRARIALSSEERHMAGRLLRMNLLWCSILLVACTAIGYAAMAWSQWILLLLIPVLLYIWTTCNCARLGYMLLPVKYKEALKVSTRRSMGLAVILQVITLLPLILAACVLLLPPVIYGLTSLAAADTRLMGDAAGYPAYLPPLYFALSALGFTLLALLGTVRTWSLAMFMSGRHGN
ncbi:MAG: hypothetical protein ACI30N_06575 [Muribaculaceae bacterium]